MIWEFDLIHFQSEFSQHWQQGYRHPAQFGDGGRNGHISWNVMDTNGHWAHVAREREGERDWQACRGYEISHAYPYPQTPSLRICSPQFSRSTSMQ